MSKKRVFVLGAGFSKSAGAPLVDEILPVAKDIFANNFNSLDSFEAEFFINVFDYYKDLRQARVKVNFDIDNIEELFSIIDMNITHSKDSKDLITTKEALSYLILKTLEVSISSTKYDKYYSLLKNLYSKKANEDFSLITFNYDLILERALENGSCNYNYCTSPKEKPISNTQKKLLKLHGSSNWLIGKECGHLHTLPTKAVGKLYNHLCPKDSKPTIPLLVPPTWNKRFETAYIKNVWYHAFEELKSANTIIFIGYSLPKTDLYFRHFLTLALKDNMKLRKIIVINPDQVVKERFNIFLEENFFRRHFSFTKAKFENLTFGEIIKGE